MVELRDLILDQGLLRHYLQREWPQGSSLVTQITDLVKLGRNRQLTVHDYIRDGCLKVDAASPTMSVSGAKGARITRAVMATRNLRGLDGALIEMPTNCKLYRGLLLEDQSDRGYARLYALAPERKMIVIWRATAKRTLDIIRECYGEGFHPVNAVPAEIHLIKHKIARREALDAYETVRSQ